MESIFDRKICSVCADKDKKVVVQEITYISRYYCVDCHRLSIEGGK